jgi:hypothetical protein
MLFGELQLLFLEASYEPVLITGVDEACIRDRLIL